MFGFIPINISTYLLEQPGIVRFPVYHTIDSHRIINNPIDRNIGLCQDQFPIAQGSKLQVRMERPQQRKVLKTHNLFPDRMIDLPGGRRANLTGMELYNSKMSASAGGRYASLCLAIQQRLHFGVQRLLGDSRRSRQPSRLSRQDACPVRQHLLPLLISLNAHINAVGPAFGSRWIDRCARPLSVIILPLMYHFPDRYASR